MHKSKRMILRPLDSASTHTSLKQSTKVKEIQCTNLKQKIENAMTRTFLKKKFSLKKNVSGQKQRYKQTQAVPKETQQISEFT